jgi:hypothetical protein
MASGFDNVIQLICPGVIENTLTGGFNILGWMHVSIGNGQLLRTHIF